jgi:hypothetical protein
MICVENQVFFKSNFLNFFAHKIYYSHLKTSTLKNCGIGKTAGKVLYPGARKGGQLQSWPFYPQERDPLLIV